MRNKNQNSNDLGPVNAMEPVALDPLLRIPKYLQVKQTMCQWISSGRIKVGESIPSLHQLCRIFNVSDTTCKKAIAELAYEGLLKGAWGKGVYVSASEKKPSDPGRSVNLLVWNHMDTLQHPAFSSFVSGLVNRLSPTQYQLVFTVLNPMTMTKEEVREKISNISGRGVIIPFIPGLREESLRSLAEKKTPVVFVTKHFADISPYFIGWDIRGAIYTVVKETVAGGKKRIAVLGSPWDDIYGQIYAGANTALTAYGLHLDAAMIKRCSYSLQGGRAGMAGLFDSGFVPDLVIADDEYVGYGALAVIRERGLKVPEQIQVIGIGGFAPEVPYDQKLSVIQVPFRQMGEEALALLLRIFEGNPGVQSDKMLSCRIMHRDTTLASGQ